MDVTKDCSLYRHWDAGGNLLYVGVSVCAVWRTEAHRAKQTAWFPEVRTITIERFGTRRDALAAEGRAIRDERPQHNRFASGVEGIRRTIQLTTPQRVWLKREAKRLRITFSERLRRIIDEKRGVK